MYARARISSVTYSVISIILWLNVPADPETRFVISVSTLAVVDRIKSMNISAAEEQSSTTEEVNRNIVSISDVAEDTATAAKQTAQSSDGFATAGFPDLHRLIRHAFRDFQCCHVLVCVQRCVDDGNRFFRCRPAEINCQAIAVYQVYFPINGMRHRNSPPLC